MCAEMFIICEVCVDWVSVKVFPSLGAELSVKHLVADGWYLSLSPVNVYVSTDKIPVLMETPWVLVLWMAPLFLHSRVVWTVFWFPEADNCWSDGRLCCFPVPAAGLHPLSRRPDTDANSSWQTLKHTSNTPMVKFVKLLTALTVRREKEKQQNL